MNIHKRENEMSEYVKCKEMEMSEDGKCKEIENVNIYHKCQTDTSPKPRGFKNSNMYG